MQVFGFRSFACRPIQGGIYQRQGAIKSIRCELNDFFLYTRVLGDTIESMAGLTCGIVGH